LKYLGVTVVVIIGLAAGTGIVWSLLQDDRVTVPPTRDVDRNRARSESGSFAKPTGGNADKPHSTHEVLTHESNGKPQSRETSDRNVQDEVQDSGSPSRERTEASVDESAGSKSAGIPFPVSASVLQYCEHLSGAGSASCTDHIGVFAQLEKEKRDPVWAPSVEAEIAAVVNSDPAFHIRALECRTTVCAVEIESIQAAIRLSFDHLDDHLSRVDRIIGYERNSANELIKVTSITFKRVGAAARDN
jgi:hypothetical protein